MTEHHHHIIISKDGGHTHAIEEGRLLTRRQERLLWLAVTLSLVVLIPLTAWALGRAWDFECEMHSDEHWAQYGYEEEVRQFHESEWRDER